MNNYGIIIKNNHITGHGSIVSELHTTDLGEDGLLRCDSVQMGINFLEKPVVSISNILDAAIS
jgi:hypothetical protein